MADREEGGGGGVGFKGIWTSGTENTARSVGAVATSSGRLFQSVMVLGQRGEGGLPVSSAGGDRAGD